MNRLRCSFFTGFATGRSSAGGRTVAAVHDGMFRRFAEAAGQPQWVEDARFAMADPLRAECGEASG
ncbi:MAG: hypothetical protein OXB98_02450 [Bryobacterales bacterium]|nr:hypothetical protein [Bryobacterales bacterium]